MTLEEVLAVIREAEEKGLTTVRLHTGEPSLYGAVREQMDVLAAEGISYESLSRRQRMLWRGGGSESGVYAAGGSRRA